MTIVDIGKIFVKDIVPLTIDVKLDNAVWIIVVTVLVAIDNVPLAFVGVETEGVVVDWRMVVVVEEAVAVGVVEEAVVVDVVEVVKVEVDDDVVIVAPYLL